MLDVLSSTTHTQVLGLVICVAIEGQSANPASGGLPGLESWGLSMFRSAARS